MSQCILRSALKMELLPSTYAYARVQNIAEQAISVGSEGKCFGYWWPGNLMANRAVEEGIKKARRSFFHHGAAIGVFQGDLSPLSSRAVVESCVMPVLLYSCENMGFNGAANFP